MDTGRRRDREKRCWNRQFLRWWPTRDDPGMVGAPKIAGLLSYAFFFWSDLLLLLHFFLEAHLSSRQAAETVCGSQCRWPRGLAMRRWRKNWRSLPRPVWWPLGALWTLYPECSLASGRGSHHTQQCQVWPERKWVFVWRLFCNFWMLH